MPTAANFHSVNEVKKPEAKASITTTALAPQDATCHRTNAAQVTAAIDSVVIAKS
jgi:hypothetical protein